MASGFSFGLMGTFWNYIEVVRYILNTTELFTFQVANFLM